MRSVRLRRGLSLAAASMALLGIPGGTTARGAELFGFDMSATATSISTLYNQPSFGVPSDPTFELRKVYSVAALDSGPSSHGLGSVLWPGQVIGNAPPSLALDTLVFNPTKIDQVGEIIQQAKDQAAKYTEGSAGYPIRSEAFYPSDETSDSDDLGAGAHMDATALEDRSAASATSGGIGVQGVIHVGSLYSRSTSFVDKGIAVAESVARLNDIDLFGMIHVDTIVTAARATSDGDKGKTEGLVQIVGLEITDQNGGVTPVIVDKNGFHVRDTVQDPLGAIAKQLFDENLAPHGISLSIGAPIPLIDGAAASVAETGLTIHLDARGMNDLLAAMPPQIRDQLLNPSTGLAKPLFQGPLPSFPEGLLSPTVAGFLATFFQGDQDINFVFGSAFVSTVASPALPPIELPPIISEPPFLPGGGGFTGGDGGGGFITTPGSSNGGGGVLAARPVAAKGVPFAFLALALALGLAGSRVLQRFADQVFAARVAARCPLEDP